MKTMKSKSFFISKNKGSSLLYMVFALSALTLVGLTTLKSTKSKKISKDYSTLIASEAMYLKNYSEAVRKYIRTPALVTGWAVGSKHVITSGQLISQNFLLNNKFNSPFGLVVEGVAYVDNYHRISAMIYELGTPTRVDLKKASIANNTQSIKGIKQQIAYYARQELNMTAGTVASGGSTFSSVDRKYIVPISNMSSSASFPEKRTAILIDVPDAPSSFGNLDGKLGAAFNIESDQRGSIKAMELGGLNLYEDAGNSTFTFPPGITTITVHAVSGGSASSGYIRDLGAVSGSSGSGAPSVLMTKFSGQPGQTISLTVGDGGLPAQNANVGSMGFMGVGNPPVLSAAGDPTCLNNAINTVCAEAGQAQAVFTFAVQKGFMSLHAQIIYGHPLDGINHCNTSPAQDYYFYKKYKAFLFIYPFYANYIWEKYYTGSTAVTNDTNCFAKDGGIIAIPTSLGYAGTKFSSGTYKNSVGNAVLGWTLPVSVINKIAAKRMGYGGSGGDAGSSGTSYFSTPKDFKYWSGVFLKGNKGDAGVILLTY